MHVVLFFFGDNFFFADTIKQRIDLRILSQILSSRSMIQFPLLLRHSCLVAGLSPRSVSFPSVDVSRRMQKTQTKMCTPGCSRNLKRVSIIHIKTLPFIGVCNSQLQTRNGYTYFLIAASRSVMFKKKILIYSLPTTVGNSTPTFRIKMSPS